MSLRQSEEEFQQAVIEYARLHRWEVYHTRDSRRSTGGFPDLVCLRDHGDVGEVLVAELKSDRGKVSNDQRWWLVTFAKAGVEAYLWTPEDWPEINRRFRERDPAPGPHPSSLGLAAALERVGAGGRGRAAGARRGGDDAARAARARGA